MTEKDLRSWLRDYDELLVLARPHINWYAIYRKCAPHAIGLPANPFDWDREWAAKGYYRVLAFHPNSLDGRVPYTLFMRDLHRHGDQETYDRIMKQYWHKLEYNRAFQSDERYHAARERLRYMNTVRVVPESDRHSAPPGGMSIMGEGY